MAEHVESPLEKARSIARALRQGRSYRSLAAQFTEEELGALLGAALDEKVLVRPREDDRG